VSSCDRVHRVVVLFFTFEAALFFFFLILIFFLLCKKVSSPNVLLLFLYIWEMLCACMCYRWFVLFQVSFLVFFFLFPVDVCLFVFFFFSLFTLHSQLSIWKRKGEIVVKSIYYLVVRRTIFFHPCSKKIMIATAIPTPVQHAPARTSAPG